MTQPEQQEIVQRSSVKVSRNAKREAQFEVKVIAGDSEEIIDEARRIAILQYEALQSELG